MAPPWLEETLPLKVTPVRSGLQVPVEPALYMAAPLPTDVLPINETLTNVGLLTPEMRPVLYMAPPLPAATLPRKVTFVMVGLHDFPAPCPKQTSPPPLLCVPPPLALPPVIVKPSSSVDVVIGLVTPSIQTT